MNAGGSPGVNSFAEKDQEVLMVFQAEDEPAMHPCSKKASRILGCVRKYIARK